MVTTWHLFIIWLRSRFIMPRAQQGAVSSSWHSMVDTDITEDVFDSDGPVSFNSYGSIDKSMYEDEESRQHALYFASEFFQEQ